MKSHVPLIRATALLVAVAALPVARIPVFPRVATALLLSLALWRMVLGSSGRVLVGRHVRLVLQTAASAAVLFLLLVSARGVIPPVVAILLLVTTVQGVSLLARQTPAVLFRMTLLSTTQAAGAAFVVRDPAALGLAGLYMVVLLATVLFFERSLAEVRAQEDRSVRGRMRVDPGAVLPLRAWATTLGFLAVVGAVGGGLLYVAAPRHLAVLGRRDAGTGADADGDVASEVSASADGAGSFITGPDTTTQGIRLGDVGKIKRDLTPYFEVRLPPGRRPFLRENTYDHYGDASWTMHKGEGARLPERIGPPPTRSGWLDLRQEDDAERGFDLELRLYRGTHRRLYLERDGVRIRVVRDGRPLRAILWRLDNEQLDSALDLRPEDRIEVRIVPPIEDGRVLQATTSDHRSSPRTSFLQLPDSARPLEAVAREVVGDETNAYRRAQRLIAWFGSDAFTYTLSMPEVNTATPVVDFVTRVRRGHCEYFASALTLMLRSLGHPARVAKGFRGGDAQEGRGTWIVRGSHYHAWTEMHFAGVGWIPLDATPPDNTALDAESVTRVAGTAEEGAVPWISRFLSYGTEDHQKVLATLGRGLDRVIVRPLRWLFGGPRLFLALPLLLLLTFRWVHGRRRRRLAARAGVASPADLQGPYGIMLGLLARRGIRRGRHQTPREFVAEVVRRVPDAAHALRGVTAHHERERYARRPVPVEERGRVKGDLKALQSALDAGSRRTRPKRT